MNSKTCTSCKGVKPHADFSKSKHHKDGLQYVCKECARQTKAAWRAANKEHIAEYNKNYWAKNTSIVKNAQHRLRAIRLGIEDTEDLPADWWEQLIEAYGEQCLACGTTEKLTADHIRPLSKGGVNTMNNYQILCNSCNSKKRDKVIDYRPTLLQFLGGNL